MSPDAIVIGAGPNGLVAANLLADAGWSVLVLEAGPEPGGAVRSDRAVHPDFVSDTFSAFYPLGIASPVLARLGLAEFGLRWTHAPQVLAHVLPDDRSALLSRDLPTTAASLERFAAGDGERWAELSAEFEHIRAPFLAALFGPFPPVRAGVTLLRRLGAADALRLARFGVNTARQFGAERFAGEGARLLLTGNTLHSDLSPESAGGALIGWLLCMLGQSSGFPVPIGGAGRLTAALVDRLAARGGQLRLGSPVARIEIADGAATGVQLESGERLSAGRAVLADVDAVRLYRDLVGFDRLPARLATDLAHFQWDSQTLKLDWALSAPIPWTAPDARQAGTIHLGVDLDGCTRYGADLATGRIPEDPFLLLGQMTTADPSRSPQGTESAWAYTHLPAGVRLSRAEVDRHVERMEAVIERHAPGFGATVRGRRVLAPLDLQAADANLVGGATNGGTAALHQQLVLRPVPGLGGASTPIDRLYLAGASAHPGGGVHGAPGANAAHRALARARLTGGARRRAEAAILRRIYAD